MNTTKARWGRDRFVCLHTSRIVPDAQTNNSARTELTDTIVVNNQRYARVAKLVDALALGASAARHEGSSPFPRTKSRTGLERPVFDLVHVGGFETSS